MTTGADPAFARSAARWLRAYPRRWRTARAAEVTALLADLAPEGSRRLDLRSGLGLVRGGWATRWREHPPLPAWLGYVLLERRLDPRYRDWVRDDIEGPLHAARRTVPSGLGGLLVYLVARAGHDGGVPIGFVGAWLVVAALVSTVGAPVHRRRAVSRHLVVHPGEVVTPSGRLYAQVARTRTAARPWLTVALTVTVAVLAGCAAVVALAPRVAASAPCGTACLTVSTAPVPPAYRWTALAGGVVGALVGLLLARRAASRLRRWTPGPQPHRWVAPLRTGTSVRLALLLVVAAALAAVAQPLTVLLAGPAAVVACVLLPVLVAARRAVGTGATRAAAGIEVLRAVAGLPDPPDRLVEGHVPATTWLPAGEVLPLPGEPPPT